MTREFGEVLSLASARADVKAQLLRPPRTATLRANAHATWRSKRAAARLDVNVAYAFARNVAVRGGLVSWGIGSSRVQTNDSSLNSRIQAGLSGLLLGLDVAF